MEDIGLIIDFSLEIHQHKTNINTVVLITEFIRSPDIYAVIRILQDNPDNTSNISKEYKKAIKKDIKNNKQYFLLDNMKYYLKHNII